MRDKFGLEFRIVNRDLMHYLRRHRGLHINPFDPDQARGRDDVVLAPLNHRLVQMCLCLLRAEVWSRGGWGKTASGDGATNSQSIE